MNARGIPTAAYQVLHLLPEAGYPPPPNWQGVPPWPGLMGGTLPGGTPPWVPPGQVWWGYLRWGTPRGGTGGVPPLAGPGWATSLSEPSQGTPPRCGQTGRHVSKHNLPVVLRTRSVIIKTACKQSCGLCSKNSWISFIAYHFLRGHACIE